MTDAGYVITGWLVTTLVIAAYFGWLVLATRRAAQDRDAR